MAIVSTNNAFNFPNSNEFVELFHRNNVEQFGFASETSITFTFQDFLGLSTFFEISGNDFSFDPTRGTVTGFQIGPDIQPILEVRDISIEVNRFLSDVNTGSVADAYRSQLRSDDLFIGAGGDDIIRSLAGDDTVRSSGGDDDIRTAAGDDLIIAGGGNDVVRGGGGADDIKGGGGQDQLFGQGGADVIRGGGGSDEFKGGGGADLLIGGGGADTLNGGKGDDMLTGSKGSDVFQFTGVFGNDVVNDFTDGSDLIDLSSLVDSIDDLQIRRRIGDVEIQVDEMTITLLDTRRSDIDENDFIF